MIYQMPNFRYEKGKQCLTCKFNITFVRIQLYLIRKKHEQHNPDRRGSNKKKTHTQITRPTRRRDEQELTRRRERRRRDRERWKIVHLYGGHIDGDPNNIQSLFFHVYFNMLYFLFRWSQHKAKHWAAGVSKENRCWAIEISKENKYWAIDIPNRNKYWTINIPKETMWELFVFYVFE
jgi:hypothetical protein